jgi:esterase/lipase superfamily enzyme
LWARIWRGDDRLSVRLIRPADNTLQQTEMTGTVVALPAGSRSVVVYIHDFNSTFKEAVVRAAMLGFDLKVPGLMALFSWPSRGTLSGYLQDINVIEASVPRLIEFLRGLAAVAGIERVHLIALGMGAQCVLSAFRSLRSEGVPKAPMFDQVVLISANVDAEFFSIYSRYLGELARRTTLYTSERDPALRLTALIHNAPRAGQYPPRTTTPGVDVIRLREMDPFRFGHGYFAGDRPFMHDLYEVIAHGLPPEKRNRLRYVPSPPHWELVP